MVETDVRLLAMRRLPLTFERWALVRGRLVPDAVGRVPESTVGRWTPRATFENFMEFAVQRLQYLGALLRTQGL